MKFKPHDYQITALNFIEQRPASALFLDMGLGKTAVCLTLIKYLAEHTFDLGKCLIIAPPRVAHDTWPREIEKWDHLQSLKYVVLKGTPKQRIAKLQEEADIYLISRDLTVWIVEYYGKDWPFDVVIIDELSSFKSHTSKRFKHLRRVRPLMKRVIGLTGTPAPNGYMDLWAELFLLDRGERLGKTITQFRRTYFDAFVLPNFTKYTIKDGAQEVIEDKIRDICLSMKARDYLPLAEPTYIDRYVDLEDQEMKLYKQMERDALVEIEDDVVVAKTAAVVSTKLLQLANGAVYDNDKQTIHVHDRKIEALEELIEEAQGEPVLVYYSFKSDYERIMKRFPEARKLEDEKDIADWNAKKIPVLVAHPASAGHGLNLQEGGSIIVWFGLPWSLELYQQANARLDRQGQIEPVRIYHLISAGTWDEQVKKAVFEKDMTQEALLKALKELKELK
ncbi:MAG: DEAD/DEAH box helicase [Clostridiaceae bacterium]|nr:DEAD/DEAH box helicase [Clostridiaceae bacterium]